MLTVVKQFRVTSPILAVRHELNSCKSNFVQLPVGTIISTARDLDEPGLVGIRAAEDELLAFVRDLRESTQSLSEVSDPY